MWQKPMLATPWDQEKHKNLFPFHAQPKYDGIRAMVGPDGRFYTRSLKLVRNKRLQALVQECSRYADLVGLDGELVTGPPTESNAFQRTTSAVMSYESEDIIFTCFYVFDIYNMKGCYNTRRAVLERRAEDLPMFMELAENQICENQKMLNLNAHIWESEGYEGTILRPWNASYKHGRAAPTTGELIKLKSFEDAEGVVVDLQEEMYNGNEATVNGLGLTERSTCKSYKSGKNTLGAITVRHNIPGFNNNRVNIGTGFTRAQRIYYWMYPAEIMGKTVKFKYLAHGSKDAPRHPVFMGFRHVDDTGR